MKALEQFKKVLRNAVGRLFCKSSKNKYYKTRRHRDISEYYSDFLKKNGAIIRLD